jgi:acyl dehydratase
MTAHVSTRRAPEVGRTASRSRLVTRGDIELFTEISGDRNPLHYDRRWPRARGSAGSSSRVG